MFCCYLFHVFLVKTAAVFERTRKRRSARAADIKAKVFKISMESLERAPPVWIPCQKFSSKMPKQLRTHDDYMKAVCFFCLRKGQHLLTQSVIAYVRQDILTSIDENFAYVPQGLCGSCRTKAYDRIKNGSSSGITMPQQNYESIIQRLKALPFRTRASPTCGCFICQIALSSGRNSFSPLPTGPVPSTASSTSPPPKTMTVCCRCFQKTGPGIRHVCQKGITKVTNMFEHLSSSPNSRQGLGAMILKKEQEVQGSNHIFLQQAGGGHPVSVFVGKNPVQKANDQISHEVFMNMQKSGDFSDAQILGIAQSFRENIGRLAIQPYLKQALIDEGESIKDFFEVREMSLQVKGDDGYELAQKPVVICKNVPAFIDYVIEERQIASKVLLKKFGADGGRAMFKICLNIIVDAEVSSPQKKRSAAALRKKDSGVKKLLILAVVEGIPETYENVKNLLSALQIACLDFSLANDFKLANMICGQQSCSSTYPCIFCILKIPLIGKAELRTIGMNKKFAKDFKASGSKDGKQFYSTVNEPLLNASDEALILDLIPPPELHIMLGISNKLLNKMNEKWGSSNVSAFLARFHIQKDSHQGKQLNGNNCVRLLQHLDDLEKLIPRNLKPYVSALRDFDNVRKACFGMTLDPNFKHYIKKFGDAFENLGLSKFPKLHVLVDHVPEFIDRKQKPLGFYSEQASESVHYDFQKTWEYFKVNNSHPSFGSQLYRAVLKYNKKHI